MSGCVSSGFILLSLKSVWTWSLQSFCPVLSYVVNLKISTAASLTSVPCRQSDLGVQYHPWSKIHSRDGFLTHSMEKDVEDGDNLRANSGFGYSGSSLPLGCIISSANFLYSNDFIRSARSSCGLVSDMQSAFGWQLGGLGLENTAGCILVRNHLHSPYPRKEDVLPRKAHTTLAVNTHHPRG